MSEPHHEQLTAYCTVPLDEEMGIPAGTPIASGQYTIHEEIGRGGMGLVYRAKDQQGGDVAVKVMRGSKASAALEARYHNEARLASNLHGVRECVAVQAVGHLDGPDGFAGRMYLVAPYVKGQGLDDLIENNRSGLALPRGAAIGLDVARALTRLHERGVVHRDVKPSNVVVTAEGTTERAKLLDFGLAFATGDGWEPRSPDLTAAGGVPGTLLYMSPQQAVHERPEASFDLYALGMLLYEMFAGAAPNGRASQEELYARKCDPNWTIYPVEKMCPELPEALTEIIDRCLAYDAGARPSAREVADVLERFVEVRAATVVPMYGTTTSATTTNRTAQQVEASPRKRWLAVIALGLLLGSSAVWWRLSRLNSEHAADATTEASVAKSRLNEPATIEQNSATNIDEQDYAAVADVAVVASTTDAVEATPQVGPSEAKVFDDPDHGDDRPHETHSNPAFPTKSDAPGARPNKTPRPNPSPATETKSLEPKLPATEPTCNEQRIRARAALKKKHWATILTATRDRECWMKVKPERIELRVESLMRLGRYTGCAKEAFRSQDPKVQEWGKQCFRRAKETKNK